MRWRERKEAGSELGGYGGVPGRRFAAFGMSMETSRWIQGRLHR